MNDTAEGVAPATDLSSDRPVFDLGFSGLSSNNQSVPGLRDIDLGDATIATTTAEEPGIHHQEPATNQSAPDFSDIGEVSIATAAVTRQARSVTAPGAYWSGSRWPASPDFHSRASSIVPPEAQASGLAQPHLQREGHVEEWGEVAVLR